MKKVFFTLSCTLAVLLLKSQEPVFNLAAHKLYHFQINSTVDSNKADVLTRSTEKMKLAVFSFVEENTGKAYFFVNNNADQKELRQYLTENGCHISDFEEIQPSNDIFLEIFMNRGGISTDKIPEQLPKYIQLGPNTELSKMLFNLANQIWEKKYPDKYKTYFPSK